MLLLASAFVSVCMRQFDDAVSITIVSLPLARIRICVLYFYASAKIFSWLANVAKR